MPDGEFAPPEAETKKKKKKTIMSKWWMRRDNVLNWNSLLLLYYVHTMFVYKIKPLCKCVTSILDFQIFVIVKVNPFQTHEIQAFFSLDRMTFISLLFLSDLQALSSKSLRTTICDSSDLWPLTPKQWWDVNWTCPVWAMMKQSMCSEWYRETCTSVRRKKRGSGNSTRECET